MKRFLAIATATIFISTVDGAADQNAALVIGNGIYKNAPKAATAVRDAHAVAEALEAAGWTVAKGTDLDRATMRKVIRDFAASLGDAEQVVIFYSGHALRTGGATYLAPTDARADSLTDVLFDGVPLDLLLEIAAEKAGKAVLFIDGAQLRGFRPTDFVEPGLAELDGPDGVLIVSAAMPGRAVRRSRWRDSRFARLIVDQFLMPGASIASVAQASGPPTYVTGSVDDDFMLAAIPDAEISGLDAEIELAFWRAAERSGRQEDYGAYLKRYPDGTFAELARERLGLDQAGTPTEAQSTIDSAVEAERQLNLSRIRRRNVQTWLQALGFDPRGIDGLFGPGSRNAIRKWQLQRGFANTGYLDQKQFDQLREEGLAALEEERRIAEEKRRISEAEDNAFWSATGARGTAIGYRAYLEKYPEGLHAKEARAALAQLAEAETDREARLEQQAFLRAQRVDTAEAYRDYLGAYPDGIYRDQALARLDEIEGREREQARRARYRATEDALRLSHQDRVSVERRLRYLGFETGPMDGNFDQRTRAAISGYQASRGFERTGYLDRTTVVTLVNDTSQPSGPVVLDGARVIEGLLDALGKR